MNRQKQAIETDAEIANITLHTGVDTLQVRSHQSVTFTAEDLPFANTKISRHSDDVYSYYIFNPNKAIDKYIERYSDYQRSRDYMFEQFPADDVEMTRIDYRFDMYEDNFDRYLKLNTILLLLIGETYKVDNTYYSKDPRTLQSLTIRIENRTIGAENYNKGIQRHDVIDLDNNVMNRLELRSKRIVSTQDIERNEFELWCDRLNKSVTDDTLNALTDDLNNHIVQNYEKWNAEAGKGFSSNVFFSEYRHSIYTREQFVKLHKLLNINNPENRVRDYIHRHSIRLYDLKNILNYKDKVIQAGERFFDC